MQLLLRRGGQHAGHRIEKNGIRREHLPGFKLPGGGHLQMPAQHQHIDLIFHLIVDNAFEIPNMARLDDLVLCCINIGMCNPVERIVAQKTINIG